MSLRRTLLWSVLTLTSVLGACSGPVQCGPCEGSRLTLVPPADLSPETVVVVEVCIEGAACVTQEAQELRWVRFPPLMGGKELTGKRATVTVTPADGTPVRTGTGIVTWYDGGGGPCSCSALRVEVPLS